MEILRPVVLPYEWGSRHGIAGLQGRPVPSALPEAELWMGAHPTAPSGAAESTLDALIAADPERELGRSCVARFGPRLPFLLKVLSADRALSIQVHPSRVQAQAGFQAENDHGPLPGDPARNFVDDWPKPELLCALTPFEVLAGLRRPADAAALLRALAVPMLAPLAAELEAATDPQAMGRALATILTWPEHGQAGLADAVLRACRALAPADPDTAPAAGPRTAAAPTAAGPYAPVAAAVVREAAHHPGDLGLVAMLLMRHVVLAPGQAVFLPAGGLHTYLRGTGIEVLANSDNVVRAGLTGKHVDVPELLELVDPAVQVPVLSPAPLGLPGDGIGRFDVPAPEFGLAVADLAASPVALPGAGPRIVLCTDGAALLRDQAGETVKLARGESCFVSAADGPLHASGPAHLFLAAPGDR
jgi:mannose-6-phosphate isomerase